MTKRALITGITGQDGSFMAELLLLRGYEVHGLVRRSSVDNTARVRGMDVVLHKGDITDAITVHEALQKSAPHEVYHFADQDNVDYSYASPWYSAQVTYGGAATVLSMLTTETRVLLPLSATMYDCSTVPQHECCFLAPMSPYACAKVGVWYLASYYREAHKLQVVCPVLYNHDSTRRCGEYLLHRLARGEELRVDKPDMRVDVGCAKEYVEHMYKLMQLRQCSDCIVATGVGYTIAELCSIAGVRLTESSAPYRPGPTRELVGDNKRLMTLVGSVPTRHAADLLLELKEHYRCA